MQIYKPEVIVVQETASTNSYLKELSQQKKMAEGTIVVTPRQYSGRGQMGTSWESEPGKNLTFSLILYPEHIAISRQFILSQMVAMAIQRVLSEETGNITVKWPNDIYHENKKICGTLIENEIAGNKISTSVIGIGLNVNQTLFTSKASNPVSLKQITGKEYDLQLMLKKITENIYQLYNDIKEGKSDFIAFQYKKILYRGDGFYTFSDKNGPFKAKIENIEPNGQLVLQTIQGDKRMYGFKEVCYCFTSPP